MYACMYVRTYMNLYVCICVHTWVYMYVFLYVHASSDFVKVSQDLVHTVCMYVSCIHMYVHVYFWWILKCVPKYRAFACTHICMHTYICTCMYACMVSHLYLNFLWVQKCVCMYMFLLVCMYKNICMYVWVCMSVSFIVHTVFLCTYECMCECIRMSCDVNMHECLLYRHKLICIHMYAHTCGTNTHVGSMYV
jgi:hypothetical protein